MRMQTIGAVVPFVAGVVLLVAPPAPAETPPRIVQFESTRAGSLPPGLRVLSSREEEPGRWQVERAEHAAVLGQVDIGRHGYRLAVLEGESVADVHVGVRLRVGRGDRAAGVAWRVQDAQNYYAARLDFDTREVVVYKFVHGSRVRLERSSDVRLDPGAWHELLVEHVGKRFRVWLNGVPVASDHDDSLQAAGTLGFWMPGDGTAQFERLWYKPLPRPANRR
jgi:hypothetical protein